MQIRITQFNPLQITVFSRLEEKSKYSMNRNTFENCSHPHWGRLHTIFFASRCFRQIGTNQQFVLTNLVEQRNLFRKTFVQERECSWNGSDIGNA